MPRHKSGKKRIIRMISLVAIDFPIAVRISSCLRLKRIAAVSEGSHERDFGRIYGLLTPGSLLLCDVATDKTQTKQHGFGVWGTGRFH